MIIKDKSSLPYSEGWYAWVEETGTKIGPAHNWAYLKQILGAYLDKNGLNVGDREAYVHLAVCRALDRDGKRGKCIKPYRLSNAQLKTKTYEVDPRIPKGLTRGRSGYDAYAWATIHLAAIDGKLDTKYMSELFSRIGCGSCRTHATRYLQTHPIGAGSATFGWTVELHNSVNRSIVKPIVSIERAREIWGL